MSVRHVRSHAVGEAGLACSNAWALGRAPPMSELRAIFDAPSPLTIGLEEEVMFVDPDTLDLAPIAAEPLDGEEGLKLEMPPSQAEIVTTPVTSVGAAIEQLASGRRRLVEL